MSFFLVRLDKSVVDDCSGLAGRACCSLAIGLRGKCDFFQHAGEIRLISVCASLS